MSQYKIIFLYFYIILNDELNSDCSFLKKKSTFIQIEKLNVEKY